MSMKNKEIHGQISKVLPQIEKKGQSEISHLELKIWTYQRESRLFWKGDSPVRFISDFYGNGIVTAYEQKRNCLFYADQAHR